MWNYLLSNEAKVASPFIKRLTFCRRGEGGRMVMREVKQALIGREPYQWFLFIYFYFITIECHRADEGDQIDTILLGWIPL